MTIYIFFLYCLLASSAVPTGFKTTVSQTGLSYLKDVAIPILEKEFGTVVIPPATGEVDTPIGTVDYEITDLTLDQINFPQSTLSVLAGKGISLGIGNAHAHIHGNWHYKRKHAPHLSDHGTMDVTVDQLTIQIDLAFASVNGVPQAAVISDGVNIGHIDIKLHGGASWLYNIFIKLFRGTIQNTIQTALQKAIETNIASGLNKALAKIPLVHDITTDIVVDYSLVANPVFGADYMTFPELGEFYSKSHRTDCPVAYCPVPPLPDKQDGNMIQIAVSEFVVNSAMYLFFSENFFREHITNDMIPAASPLKLNTSTWQVILPALYQKYPNDLMTLDIFCTLPPQFLVAPSGISSQAIFEMDFNVLTNLGSVLAFSVGATANLAFSVAMNGTTVTGKIDTANFDFHTKQTNIGPIDLSNLVTLLNYIFGNVAVNFVNSELAKGYTLPVVNGLSFVAPKIIEQDGYLGISSSFHYNG